MPHRTARLLPVAVLAGALALPGAAQAAVPTVSFTSSPVIATNEPTDLTVAAANADGIVYRYEWDLDNNGSYERTTGAPSLQVVFNASGVQTVGVRVTDSEGEQATATQPLTISARPGKMTVTVHGQRVGGGADGAVIPGTTVFLEHTPVSDPDGEPLTYAWDLDGDGTFETPEANGFLPRFVVPNVAQRFGAVRAVDPHGLAATSTFHFWIARTVDTRDADRPAIAPAPESSVAATAAPKPRTSGRRTSAAAGASASGGAIEGLRLTRRGGTVTCKAAAGTSCKVQVLVGGRLVGSGRGVTGASGRGTVSVRLTAKARRALRKGTKATVKVAFGGADGGSLSTSTRVR